MINVQNYGIIGVFINMIHEWSKWPQNSDIIFSQLHKEQIPVSMVLRMTHCKITVFTYN